jgi:polyribonucleotide nucleotidyltransferase
MKIGIRSTPTQDRTTGKGRHYAVKYSVPSYSGGFTVRWFAYETREAAEAKLADVRRLNQARKAEIVKVTSAQASEIFQGHWDRNQPTDAI